MSEQLKTHNVPSHLMRPRANPISRAKYLGTAQGRSVRSRDKKPTLPKVPWDDKKTKPVGI